MRERAVPLTLLTATLGFKIDIKRRRSDCFQFGREIISVERLSIGLVIGAFVFVKLARCLAPRHSPSATAAPTPASAKRTMKAHLLGVIDELNDGRDDQALATARLCSGREPMAVLPPAMKDIRP